MSVDFTRAVRVWAFLGSASLIGVVVTLHVAFLHQCRDWWLNPVDVVDQTLGWLIGNLAVLAATTTSALLLARSSSRDAKILATLSQALVFWVCATLIASFPLALAASRGPWQWGWACGGGFVKISTSASVLVVALAIMIMEGKNKCAYLDRKPQLGLSAGVAILSGVAVLLAIKDKLLAHGTWWHEELRLSIWAGAFVAQVSCLRSVCAGGSGPKFVRVLSAGIAVVLQLFLGWMR